MSHWQLLTSRVHYLHADGTRGEHVSTSDSQRTQSVSKTMAQLVFSPAVWAVELLADGTRVQLTSVGDAVSGAFLVRASVAEDERYLVYSRRRGAEFTAQLPTGRLIFTADQMFTASPQVFFTICSTLDQGFDAVLGDGLRWKSTSGPEPIAAEAADLERLQTV